MSEIFTYTFHWFANPGACRKCQALNGRSWTDQDLFAAQLVDPEYGPVWDLNADVSLAHPHCKCRLHVAATLNIEATRLRQLFDTIQKTRETARELL